MAFRQPPAPVAPADIPSSLDAFIARWSSAGASERANAQLFLAELADLLGVPRPGNDHADGYSFEFPVKIPTGPGQSTDGRIDLYRRGAFVLEAKQFVAPKAEQTDLQLAALASGAGVAGGKKSGPIRDSAAWDDAMWRAKGQAERYARHLPSDEPPAPFLLVVDVGHSIEVYADFTQAGRAYQAFPDPRSFRLRLDDLRDDKVRERLRRIWLDPLSLDPAKVSAEVTREIAGYLATLASSLEDQKHTPKIVAEFLTRCLFCMFAEDVGLLPKDSFRGLLESLRQSPEGFVPKLRQLFAEMQTGTDFSVILNKKLLQFNGGLFEDASVLPLDGTQLGILIKASTMQWKDVEPAIFGTLLERARSRGTPPARRPLHPARLRRAARPPHRHRALARRVGERARRRHARTPRGLEVRPRRGECLPRPLASAAASTFRKATSPIRGSQSTVRRSETMNFTTLELCAGGGGQALGLEMAGFHHAAAVEYEPQFCTTLRTNRPHWNVIQQDIRNLRPNDFTGLDLLAAGVPCPPFSIAGKQLGSDDERDMFPAALALIEGARPRGVLFENVQGLASEKFSEYRRTLLQRLSKLGYQPEWRVLQAADFGVPQLRPRFILVALRPRDAECFRWPAPLPKRQTVGDTLVDLMGANGWRGAEAWALRANRIAPTIVGGSKKHGGPDLGPTRAKRQWRELSVDGMGIADEAPGETLSVDAFPRLTVRMVARIQGFPDTWHFTGKKTISYRQVGNAFPPLVAKAVGRCIHSAFKKQFSYVDIPIEDDVEMRLLEEPTKPSKPCRAKKDRKH